MRPARLAPLSGWKRDKHTLTHKRQDSQVTELVEFLYIVLRNPSCWNRAEEVRVIPPTLSAATRARDKQGRPVSRPARLATISKIGP